MTEDEKLIVDAAERDEEQAIVDEIILTCSGCAQVRVFKITPPLVGGQAIVDWLKTRPNQCPCGARTCSVEMHLKPQN